MKFHLSLISRKMAVYCGQQTKYAKVNFGEPGTAQHTFYRLTTIPCLFAVLIAAPITFYRAALHPAPGQCAYSIARTAAFFNPSPFNSCICRLSRLGYLAGKIHESQKPAKINL
tara:strand:- start:169 stop:510 length:342 start_codon:yes stop_codon:yes gene_type:complete